MLRECLTLTIEHVAAKALAHGHAQIDIEANTGDADAGVILVLGEEEGVVVVMVVRVARVGASLRLGRHGGRGNVSYAMDCRGPVERQSGSSRVLGALCVRRRLQDARLWTGKRRRVGAT